MSETVRDILRQKEDQVRQLAGEAKVYAALALMAEKKVAALVVKTSGEVVGILSERGCLRKLETQRRLSRKAFIPTSWANGAALSLPTCPWRSAWP